MDPTAVASTSSPTATSTPGFPFGALLGGGAEREKSGQSGMGASIFGGVVASPFANLTGVTGGSVKGQASWSSPFLGPAWGSGSGTNTSASTMGAAGSVSIHPFAASSSASASAGNAAGGGFIFPAAAKEERAGGAEGVRTGSMQMQAPANHLGGVPPFGASFAASEPGKASGINTVPAVSRWPQVSAAPWNLSFSSFESPAGLSFSSLSSNSSIFGGGLAELVAQGRGISGQRFERGKPIFDLGNGGGGGCTIYQTYDYGWVTYTDCYGSYHYNEFVYPYTLLCVQLWEMGPAYQTDACTV